jgi:hypothetical protein
MPLTVTPLPFGVRDLKITPLTGEVPGTSIDLPNIQTLTFSESEDNEELRGDDGVVAVHGLGTSVDWDLEAGGIPLEAIKAMFGGEIEETGTAPQQVKTYHKTDIDERPYFQLEGQAISDSGGDFHVVLFKAKCTGELSGDFADGSFFITAASGRALGRTSDRALYDFVQNEEVTPIAP